MRESNFAFPAQNKACVCITSQLYDRRALDTSSALPLFNSLTHLTYLTSTSPRIREIMTMDGGLERLVRILHDFCLAPPPPASPAAFYGLLPPNYRPSRPPPQLNPPAGQFDKHAAYRFSLAFQCVVNIGVRGSEPIRSRVVQAGTLDVVGCILEAWLAGRGFAVGPSTSATGLPRETREARAARRAAAAAASRGRVEETAEHSSVTEQRLPAIDTNAVAAPRPTHTPDDVYNYIIANYPGANPRPPGATLTTSNNLRRDDELEATTPIVRDRSATVVVRRRGEGHARDNATFNSNTHSTAAIHALARLQAVRQDAPPPSPSPSASSSRGSPSSSTSTGAGTSVRASGSGSRASSVGRVSPIDSTMSRASPASSRASPSPSTRTDTDTDGDVEMMATGVAGIGAGAADLGGMTMPHGHVHREGRGRVGDSSASASPSPPPLNMGLNMNIQTGDPPPGMMNMGTNMAAMNLIGMGMGGMGMTMGGMMAGGIGMMGMDGMGMMGLNRDPRIAGEEGGVGMGIGGEEGMEGETANMMLNMGMMNADVGMMGLDGGMGMLGGGMGMMGMNMGMNMGPLGMMGGMPLPLGMGDVSGAGGGDSEARADTDVEAEESDVGTTNNLTISVSTHTLGPRRREEDMQTQTPRAGVVRLPSPISSSPGAGPSSASSSSAVYDEEEGDIDEEEGEVVVAVRGSSGNASGSGTVRRAGTVRAMPMRPPLPEAAAAESTSSNAVETWVAGSVGADGSVHSLSYRDRADTAPQSPPSPSSISVPPPLPASAAPRASQHHTPYPGAPRVPAAPTPAARTRRATVTEATEPTAPALLPATARIREREERHHHSHPHSHPTGPYRDEDVLLSLQLLAYLSKYPHVRQAFYKRRNGFHPASALALAAAKAADAPEQPMPKPPEMVREKGRQGPGGQQLAFFRAFGVAGKEKEKGKSPASSSSRGSHVAASTATPAGSTSAAARPALETNVFSLVERFTFRPSSSETDLPNPPPKLPQEIQYWAGVIMRNACRKDDSRGGIRQCANMLCGRWEEYPREFAKCRRCRKAKYCGKECQSTAWSEGHRFWCSAKEGDEAPDATAATLASNMATSPSNATIIPDAQDMNAILPVGAERRERRERHAARERERLAATTNSILGGSAGGTAAADAATVRGFRSAGILGAHPNTVSAVFGGAPATTPANPLAGPSRERGAPAAPAESTRTRAMALLRRTTNPLGAVGTPPSATQRRDREREPRERDREINSSYATFDTYMAERRRAETSAAAASAGASTAPSLAATSSYLHHPQPQNPADIDRYLASFASPPRRRVSRASRDGDSSLSRTSGTIREPPPSGGGAGDRDNMVLE